LPFFSPRTQPSHRRLLHAHPAVGFVSGAPRGQLVPCLEAPTPDAKPVDQLYAHPVKHSKPLFLLQEAATGLYHLSTDPALLNRKEPFANPYPDESHPKHVGFQNRVQYVNYEGRTKSISLLGFVIPREKADERKHRYSFHRHHPRTHRPLPGRRIPCSG